MDDVPGRDRFPIDFTTAVLGKVMTYVANEADADSAFRRRLRKMDTPLTDVALGASTAVRAVAGVVGTVIGVQAESRRLQSIDDYNSLFHVIGLPPISKDFELDSTFAELRLAGPNPMMIHRIDKLDDRFPVTDEHFQISLPGDTLAAAGAEGRLYLVDYRQLDGIETGVTAGGLKKYLYAPLALFAVDCAQQETYADRDPVQTKAGAGESDLHAGRRLQLADRQDDYRNRRRQLSRIHYAPRAHTPDD